MKCSLGISNFLEEISSLFHSVFFLYFFALIAEEDFLISPCYSLEVREGAQGASRVAPGKSGLHVRGEGERARPCLPAARCEEHFGNCCE